ncbi:sugar-specific transcriptional regulator TrmB [bacterium BMS3Abin05]|nr:sugar-specific transcriptional regulator TrmB [bacterium BMS3Abin05]GBE26817.1 sugar-specific transcriptional regulator TrmB [bacterium BMS3Bbin03]HDK35998.1 TrmB family transcriptional regulator [Bacteroidota bacterium]
MIEKIITVMKELGFTAYETKTYIYLLKNNPATRYELSKYSGVPRSAIYNVIRKLEEAGYVNAIHSEPKRFIPLPPEQLFRLLESRFHKTVNELKELLNSLGSSREMDHLWNIEGYENLILKAKDLIQEARQSIYLSVWRREVLLLKNKLLEAENRGVKIVLFSFTEIPFSVGRVLSHGLKEKELEKIWDHKIILCVDQKELIMGEADKALPKKVAWTRNRALISIALNHIVLDITLFGQRYGVNIDDCVIEMRPGELEVLGRLLSEKKAETLRNFSQEMPDFLTVIK